jgi:hypothetical protein
MENKGSLPHSQVLATSLWMIRNMIHFYGEELLARRPTPKLEDHTSSAVRDSLFNIFAATVHGGGRFFIRNLMTSHAVVRGPRLSQTQG